MRPQATPGLRSLMAAYFQEDFQDVHGGVWQTLDAFVADDPAESAGLPAEIAAVLATFPSEEATQDYAVSLGCCYQPQPGEGGYRGWLTEIARRVSAAGTAAEQPEPTPALRHLLSAYFHQDWFHEHGDEWANVDDFIAGSPGLVARLPDEIAEVLATHTDDASLETYLFSLGSCYTSDVSGGYRGWLTEIARRVSAAVSGPGLD